MSTIAGELNGIGIAASRPAYSRRWIDPFLRALALVCAVLTNMSFLDHLEELRRRIIKSVIAVAVGVLLCTAYTPAIIRFLKAPAAEYGLELVGYGGLEMFSLYFHVGLAAGICVAAPVILFQAWRFIEPALHTHEKRYALPFLASTTVFFILGVIFGYAFAMPYMMQMQQALAVLMDIRYNPSAIEYVKLLTATVIAMGAVFEMPPIVFILSRIGLVNARFLVRNMNHAFLILLILAAILTPSGDLGPTLAFVAVMMALYLFSILVALCFGKKRTTA